MFFVSAKSSVIVFAKIFAAANAEEVVQEVLARKAGRVVFIDTPSTEGLLAAVTRLKAEGVAVVLRDHHGCPEPKNDREKQVAAANQALRDLLGDAAHISTREAHPACSGLVEVGEFATEGTLVVADADADGLTAALKAVGVWYPELDADAAVLDGPAAKRTPDRLSACAALLTKGFAAVPSFDPKNPGPNQKGMQTLFQRFADAVQGDEAQGRHGEGRRAVRGRRRRGQEARRRRRRGGAGRVARGCDVIVGEVRRGDVCCHRPGATGRRRFRHARQNGADRRQARRADQPRG